MNTLSKEEFFLRYDIDIRDGRLGGGAFGTVYKAWDNLKDEWKAIKIAEVKIINGKEFSLISEFDATKEIPIHKNIINYESVHKFTMPNGVFDYAVMQYYPHGNLKQLYKSEKLKLSNKIELISGLFSGIKALHDHGVIHRDIKPSNILISERKGHFTPKIADFGLSKNVDVAEISEVTNSFGGGTLEYSSPEQLLGKSLRYNTDIWALGVIAYELFIGNIPFVPDQDAASAEVKRRMIYQNIVNAPIPSDIHKCPTPFQEIIRKCLIKDPSKRIKSADEVIKLISEFSDTSIVEDPSVALKVEDSEEATIIISKTESLEEVSDIKTDESVLKIEDKPNIKERPLTESTDVFDNIIEQEEVETYKDSSQEGSTNSSNKTAISKFPISEIWIKNRKRIILISLVLFFIAICFVFYNQYHSGPSFYKSGNRFGIVNEQGDKLSKQLFDSHQFKGWGKSVATRNDSLFEVDKKGKVTFINEIIDSEKDIIIPSSSEDSLAFVNIANAESIKVLENIVIGNEAIRQDIRYIQKQQELLATKDSLDWMKAKRINTPDSYSDYRSSNPSGKFVEDAKAALTRLVEASPVINDEKKFFDFVMASGNPDVIQTYIDKYSNGKYTVQATTEVSRLNREKEDRDWEVAKRQDNRASYQSFMDLYPLSSRVVLAVKAQKRLLEEEMKAEWNKIRLSKKIADFQSYDKRYPASPFKKQIKSKIYNIEAEELWNKASVTNDTLALNRIINEYAESGYAEKAQKRLSELPKPKVTPPNETRPRVISDLVSNMVSIKGGPYNLGCTDDCDDDNAPLLAVQVNDFKIAKYEVTQEEYKSITGLNPSTFSDCNKCPVENVSFVDALNFIQKLNEKYKTNFRLPTEVEWEYAAKAGTRSKYSGGSDLISVGVYKSNSNNGTQQVGSKKKNKYGLYDMSGNVYEWCDSAYSINGYGKDKNTTNEKVVRGGSWRSRSERCRVDKRGKNVVNSKNGWTGFRLASD